MKTCDITFTNVDIILNVFDIKLKIIYYSYVITYFISICYYIEGDCNVNARYIL